MSWWAMLMCSVVVNRSSYWRTLKQPDLHWLSCFLQGGSGVQSQLSTMLLARKLRTECLVVPSLRVKSMMHLCASGHVCKTPKSRWKSKKSSIALAGASLAVVGRVNRCIIMIACTMVLMCSVVFTWWMSQVLHGALAGEHQPDHGHGRRRLSVSHCQRHLPHWHTWSQIYPFELCQFVCQCVCVWLVYVCVHVCVCVCTHACAYVCYNSSFEEEKNQVFLFVISELFCSWPCKELPCDRAFMWAWHNSLLHLVLLSSYYCQFLKWGGWEMGDEGKLCQRRVAISVVWIGLNCEHIRKRSSVSVCSASPRNWNVSTTLAPPTPSVSTRVMRSVCHA